jgi:hypothetical protein
VLATVVFMQAPLAMDAIAALSNMDTFGARIMLESFHSVIDVPATEHSPVTMFHTSFCDFIVNPSRCRMHSLDVFEGHRMLTVKCLQCLNQALKHNILDLDFNMTFSPSHEPNVIRHGVRYSCLHWASHLAYALEAASAQNSVSEVQDLLSEFVDKHLLHWFESLSTLRELEGIKSLDRAKEAISVSANLSVNKISINPFLRLFRRTTEYLRIHCHFSSVVRTAM